MFIQNSDLCEGKHAQITFTQQCQYILKDVGKENDRNAGVWVRIPLVHNNRERGLDLYENGNLRRKYMIGKHKFMFHFEETTDPVKEVELWLKDNDMDFATKMVRGEQIERLDSLF